MNKLIHYFLPFLLLLISPVVGARTATNSFRHLNLLVYPLTNNFSDKSDDNWLFVNDQVAISNIYPNPASDHVSLNCIFYDAQTQVKVVFRNVLGSIIAEFTLAPHERQWVLPVDKFIPGVYFYTLWINNKSVVTKKLVVKR
ncbi:MAG: T9SS type A sorting domain-containing protein [Cytophagales bacterium]|nr:T9SS type A sorting domain-containing protein [Bernardetiaceae bacterium]MDW8206150.1 T9SS type A sorting domain-containing protein [Cytophagales bacterium]